MDFDDLMGKTCDFHGVDNCRFRLGFEGKLYTFEAVEDPDDGYRSMLETVRLVPDSETTGIFFDTPVAQVIPVEFKDTTIDRLTDTYGFDGYELRDAATGHVWLRFGTNEADNYCPTFVFDYELSGAQHPPVDTAG